MASPRPTQPRTPLSILWHLIAFSSLSLSFRWLYSPSPVNDFMATSFGGRWAFLTILSYVPVVSSAVFSLSSFSSCPFLTSLPASRPHLFLRHRLGVTHLVFLLSLLYDILPLPFLARLKTSLAVVAVPVEGLVGLLYWGMTLYDPTLLVPEGAEFQLPFLVDVSIHGRASSLSSLFSQPKLTKMVGQTSGIVPLGRLPRFLASLPEERPPQPSFSDSDLRLRLLDGVHGLSQRLLPLPLP
jgi:hypothetical protein